MAAFKNISTNSKMRCPAKNDIQRDIYTSATSKKLTNSETKKTDKNPCQ
jgi:hypothetical protein